jgi:hypothetical protein
MKKYYIIAPDADINSICASMLDEDSFHSDITVVDSDETRKSLQAWEVTAEQLQKIFRCVQDKNIPLKRFRVGTLRRSKNQTLRWVQKKEYIPGYQSQNKRPERLRAIQGERRRRHL